MSKMVLQALVQKHTDCVWGEEGLNTWREQEREKQVKVSRETLRQIYQCLHRSWADVGNADYWERLSLVLFAQENGSGAQTGSNVRS